MCMCVYVYVCVYVFVYLLGNCVKGTLHFGPALTESINLQSKPEPEPEEVLSFSIVKDLDTSLLSGGLVVERGQILGTLHILIDVALQSLP